MQAKNFGLELLASESGTRNP